MATEIVEVTVSDAYPAVVEVTVESPIVVTVDVTLAQPVEVTVPEIPSTTVTSCERGPQGLTGPQGDRGPAFTYSDFTSQQLLGLKGPKGDKGDTGTKGDTGEHGDKGDTGAPFVYSMFTAPQLAALKGDKGEKGNAFTYADFTSGQLLALTGPAGANGTNGTNGTNGEKGEKGDAFVYDDFTSEQLAALKGNKGDTGDAFTYLDFTSEQLIALTGPQGAKGDAFTYSDFTTEQLLLLKGEKGDTGSAFTYSDFTPEQLLALTGPQGAKGDTGTSVSIIGSIPDAHIIDDPQATLSAAFPDAVIGNGVVAQDDGHLWVYDGATWIDVGLIRGPQGDTGSSGPKGDKGDAFTYSDFTPEQLALLVGPAGDKGDNGDTFTYEDFTPEQLTALTGPKGDTGETGPPGPGVPTGGATGQVLAKIDGTDYNTQWVNQTGGGGGIALTDLSVGTPNSASDSGAISYNNTNGVFTYTPPALSSYLTAAVTSIATSGNVNGITLTGGTITSTGTITLGGTLGDIANSQLSHSTISGVALGSNLFDLTISSPLSGTSYNGSSAATIALATAYGDTQNPYASKTANYFLAAPNGSTGAPTFRAIVAADIPTLNQNTSGSAGSVTNALTAGTGISYSSGTTYNGSAAITISNSDRGSSQNIFKTVAVSGQTSVTAASNTETLTLVAGTNVTLTTDNTAKSVTIGLTGGSSPTFTNITSTGQLFTNQIDETFNTVTPSNASSVTFDCSTGQIFNITMTSLAQNFAANFSNLNMIANKATNVTLIINQGATTAYIPTSVTIPSGTVTFAWQGGTPPTGTINKKDIVAFSILCTATNTYTVFGQLVTFG